MRPYQFMIPVDRGPAGAGDLIQNLEDLSLPEPKLDFNLLHRYNLDGRNVFAYLQDFIPIINTYVIYYFMRNDDNVYVSYAKEDELVPIDNEAGMNFEDERLIWNNRFKFNDFVLYNHDQTDDYPGILRCGVVTFVSEARICTVRKLFLMRGEPQEIEIPENELKLIQEIDIATEYTRMYNIYNYNELDPILPPVINDYINEDNMLKLYMLYADRINNIKEVIYQKESTIQRSEQFFENKIPIGSFCILNREPLRRVVVVLDYIVLINKYAIKYVHQFYDPLFLYVNEDELEYINPEQYNGDDLAPALSEIIQNEMAHTYPGTRRDTIIGIDYPNNLFFNPNQFNDVIIPSGIREGDIVLMNVDPINQEEEFDPIPVVINRILPEPYIIDNVIIPMYHVTSLIPTISSYYHYNVSMVNLRPLDETYLQEIMQDDRYNWLITRIFDRPNYFDTYEFRTDYNIQPLLFHKNDMYSRINPLIAGDKSYDVIRKQEEDDNRWNDDNDNNDNDDNEDRNWRRVRERRARRAIERREMRLRDAERRIINRERARRQAPSYIFDKMGRWYFSPETIAIMAAEDARRRAEEAAAEERRRAEAAAAEERRRVEEAEQQRLLAAMVVAAQERRREAAERRRVEEEDRVRLLALPPEERRRIIVMAEDERKRAAELPEIRRRIAAYQAEVNTIIENFNIDAPPSITDPGARPILPRVSLDDLRPDPINYFNRDVRDCHMSEEDIELIKGSDIWTGFEKSEYDTIHSEQIVDGKLKLSYFCPICLGWGEKSGGCLYINHSCTLSSWYHPRLYNRYQDFGKTCTCVDCGRICMWGQGAHTHFNLSPVNATIRDHPDFGYPFNATCTLAGGGSLLEKAARIQAMADIYRDLTPQAGNLTKNEVKIRVVESCWLAYPRVWTEPEFRERVFSLMRNGRMVFPEELLVSGGGAGSSNNSNDVEVVIRPPLVEKHFDVPIVRKMKVGEMDPISAEGPNNNSQIVPGIILRHQTRNEIGRFVGPMAEHDMITPQTLKHILESLAHREGICFGEGCNGVMWPQEIEAAAKIVQKKFPDEDGGLTPEFVAEYKKRFIAANKSWLPKLRRPTGENIARIMRRNVPEGGAGAAGGQAGGGQTGVSNMYSRLTDETCYLPAINKTKKVAGGKRKSKRRGNGLRDRRVRRRQTKKN